jgi:hypothetical protein
MPGGVVVQSHLTNGEELPHGLGSLLRQKLNFDIAKRSVEGHAILFQGLD